MDLPKASQPPDPCVCEAPSASHEDFHVQYIGVDETDGRYGDVSALTCKRCGQCWLRYFVEYEAFRASGRWARGPIDGEAARSITPEQATEVIAGMEWHLFGGSFFDGRSGRRSGAMHWGV
jgi:hypothetical protein